MFRHLRQHIVKNYTKNQPLTGNREFHNAESSSHIRDPCRLFQFATYPHAACPRVGVLFKGDEFLLLLECKR